MASFNIDFPGTPQQFVVNANNAITSKGGIFKGTEQSGTFSLQTKIGKVEGNYEVLPHSEAPTKVSVTITKKPFIVPMSTIREVIGGYF
jgi:hypothetical protein